MYLAFAGAESDVGVQGDEQDTFQPIPSANCWLN